MDTAGICAVYTVQCFYRKSSKQSCVNVAANVHDEIISVSDPDQTLFPESEYVSGSAKSPDPIWKNPDPIKKNPDPRK